MHQIYKCKHPHHQSPNLVSVCCTLHQRPTFKPWQDDYYGFPAPNFRFLSNLNNFTPKLKGSTEKILTAIFWKNSLVPDLAMVPRFLTRSSFVIPMPVSVTWRMLFSLSALILIDNSSVAARADLSVSDKNLILSNASEELEISSLKKIWKKKR